MEINYDIACKQGIITEYALNKMHEFEDVIHRLRQLNSRYTKLIRKAGIIVDMLKGGSRITITTPFATYAIANNIYKYNNGLSKLDDEKLNEARIEILKEWKGLADGEIRSIISSRPKRVVDDFMNVFAIFRNAYNSLEQTVNQLTFTTKTIDYIIPPSPLYLEITLHPSGIVFRLRQPPRTHSMSLVDNKEFVLFLAPHLAEPFDGIEKQLAAAIDKFEEDIKGIKNYIFYLA